MLIRESAASIYGSVSQILLILLLLRYLPSHHLDQLKLTVTHDNSEPRVFKALQIMFPKKFINPLCIALLLIGFIIPRRPNSETTLLIGHIKHFHLIYRVFPADPIAGVATFDAVYELLQLVSERHPSVHSPEFGKFTTGFLE